MLNQMKLNLNIVRWVLIVTGITLVLNVGYILVDYRLMEWFSNMLTLVSVSALLVIILEYHRHFKNNESYRVYFTMPLKKESLIKTDFVMHMVVLGLVTAVIMSWLLATDNLQLFYAVFMITGLSLITSSVYLYQYAKHWFKLVNYSTVVIYIIPFALMMMFYMMPLINTFNDGLNLGSGWMFFLTKVPFIIFAVGVIMNTVSYFKAKQQILKTDID